MEPIVIYLSVNREGATFALKPTSRALLKMRFGEDVHIRTRIFITHESQADYAAVHSDLASQVVQILTGLSVQRLTDGGYAVEFRDPETETKIPQ
ncbi:MAG: hypothetical protein RL701_5313, partial [Pseudomonadota bacterium]